MRIKLAALSVYLLSVYLLGLNVISLQHSFEHHAGKKPALHLNDTLSVASSDSYDLLCELCDFFQTKFFTFLRKSSSLHLLPVLLPAEKRATIELIELFNQHLRGPPALPKSR